MNGSAVKTFIREHALTISIILATTVAILLSAGVQKTLYLSLLVFCAYCNALFLRAPLCWFKSPSVKSIAIVLGMLAGNAALLTLLNFDLLIPFLVWLPAVTGVVMAHVTRENKRSQ